MKRACPECGFLVEVEGEDETKCGVCGTSMFIEVNEEDSATTEREDKVAFAVAKVLKEIANAAESEGVVLMMVTKKRLQIMMAMNKSLPNEAALEIVRFMRDGLSESVEKMERGIS